MAEQQVNSMPPTQAERSGNQPTATGELSVEAENPESIVSSEEPRRAIARLGEFLKKPSVGASVTGTVVLGAAAVFGVVEAAVAAGAAYAAYRLLRKRPSGERSPS